MLPLDVDMAKVRCREALHLAKFKDIVVEPHQGGFRLTAKKNVGTQWTKTPISITLLQGAAGTAMSVYSSATPHSLVSLARRPSAVVVKQFLDKLMSII